MVEIFPSTGNACQAQAIINGEDKIGLCVHKMIGIRLDNGDIISRTYIKIERETSIGDVYKKFEKLIPKMLIDSINKLDSNPNFILEKQSTDPEEIIELLQKTRGWTYRRILEQFKCSN